MYNLKVPQPSTLVVDPAVSSCLAEGRIYATLANPKGPLLRMWAFSQWNRLLLTRIDLFWLVDFTCRNADTLLVGAAVSLVECLSLGAAPLAGLHGAFWICLDCSSCYTGCPTAYHGTRQRLAHSKFCNAILGHLCLKNMHPLEFWP